jgi:hypothetical protein
MGSWNARKAAESPDMLDCLVALEALQQEFDLRAGLTFVPAELGVLSITCRVWRDVGGERVGIAIRAISFPNSRHKSAEAAALWCIHHCYQDTADKAYAPRVRKPHEGGR